MSMGSKKDQRKRKLRSYSVIDSRPNPVDSYAGQEGVRAAARIPVRPSRRKGLIGRLYGRK